MVNKGAAKAFTLFPGCASLGKRYIGHIMAIDLPPTNEAGRPPIGWAPPVSSITIPASYAHLPPESQLVSLRQERENFKADTEEYRDWQRTLRSQLVANSYRLSTSDAEEINNTIDVVSHTTDETLLSVREVSAVVESQVPYVHSGNLSLHKASREMRDLMISYYDDNVAFLRFLQEVRSNSVPSKREGTLTSAAEIDAFFDSL